MKMHVGSPGEQHVSVLETMGLPCAHTIGRVEIRQWCTRALTRTRYTALFHEINNFQSLKKKKDRVPAQLAP